MARLLVDGDDLRDAKRKQFELDGWIATAPFEDRITSYNVCYTKLLRAQRDPGLPFNPIHDEAVVSVVEKQGLVAEQRQIGHGRRRSDDYGPCAIQVFRPRWSGSFGGGSQ